MASILPYSLGQDVAVGNVDFDSHTFKFMMMTASYTPSKAHSKRSDLTNEVSGTGYTAGGAAQTFSVNRVNGVTTITPSVVTFTAANGFTARYAACYRARGGASSADELVYLVDFTTGQVANGLDFQVTVGAFTLTVP